MRETPDAVQSIIEAAAFRRRVAERLSLSAPPGERDGLVETLRLDPRGDHEIDPELKALIHGRKLREAAVLIPVVDRGEAMVLLTERAGHLRDHSGQVAFPGGKIDEADAGPVETALREAEEEIGLDRRLVTPIGLLDVYLSATGYRIQPVVAIVAPDFALTLNHDEVADAFEVPLGFLMDIANHRADEREWRGRLRRHLAIPFGERYIWGVTAGILKILQERICD